MDSREITGWMVHERVNGPLGSLRLDYLFAQLQATIANANKGKGGKTYTPADFAPKWANTDEWPWSEKAEKGPQTGRDMLDEVKKMMQGR